MNENDGWSDLNLMAYVDDELEGGLSSEIERALQGDARLRERVAALRAQRERVAAAFAPVLDEPMPDRLSALLAPPSAAVVSLDAARAARAPRRPSSSWARWGGIAASVLVGVLVGTQFPRGDGDASIALHQGRLVAGGAVGQALSTRLASAPVADAVAAVQLSFLDKEGRVCRTFSTQAVAGLACRQGEAWTVQTLVAAERQASGDVRQAASALPRAVLDAVDQRIDGTAFDAVREKQARDRGWQR